MADDPLWYAVRDGQQIGPLSRVQLDGLISTGQLKRNDLVWREGWAQWAPADTMILSAASNARQVTTKSSPGRVAKPRRRWGTVQIAVAIIGLIGALGGALLSNWQFFFPPRPVSDVEQCDKSLIVRANGEYAGVYQGIVRDASGPETVVQIKLVRNGNTAQGSYFRDGACGTVYGDIVDGKMNFTWRWAGGSGHGIAAQQGAKLTAKSGYGDATEGAGALDLYQR
jgi:hypothetical protein